MKDYRDYALQLVEDGLVDPNTLLVACLKYMKMDDVEDMLDCNELSERFMLEDMEDAEEYLALQEMGLA